MHAHVLRRHAHAHKKPSPKVRTLAKLGTSASVDIAKGFLFEHYIPASTGLESLGWIFVGLVVVLFVGKAVFVFLGSDS